MILGYTFSVIADCIKAHFIVTIKSWRFVALLLCCFIQLTPYLSHPLVTVLSTKLRFVFFLMLHISTTCNWNYFLKPSYFQNSLELHSCTAAWLNYQLGHFSLPYNRFLVEWLTVDHQVAVQLCPHSSLSRHQGAEVIRQHQGNLLRLAPFAEDIYLKCMLQVYYQLVNRAGGE